MKIYIVIITLLALQINENVYCQEHALSSRTRYVSDIIDRTTVFDNMYEYKLSVYFKNEDNGQVNLGYISPLDLFEIEHGIKYKINYYQHFTISVRRQLQYDTVFYTSDKMEDYKSYFVDEAVITNLKQMSLEEIKSKYFIRLSEQDKKQSISANDSFGYFKSSIEPRTKVGLECYLDRLMIPTFYNGSEEIKTRMVDWSSSANFTFFGGLMIIKDGKQYLYSYDKNGKIIGVREKTW